GRTIVVVSHSLGLVQQLCKEVIWLDKGRIKQRGSAAEVIAAYTGGNPVQTTHRHEAPANRRGTGDARINSIELLNRDGTAIQTVESMQEIAIRIELSAHARIESPVLQVQISRLNGDVIWSTSTRRATNTIKALEGAATATLKIDSLRLLEGNYFLSATVTDSTGSTEFDNCQNWLQFNVRKTNLFDDGVLALESNWHLERHHR
ncbi:MAG: Wzt carbohydrate-binding domain-containing protein, partial [Actinomycetota bacterium]